MTSVSEVDIHRSLGRIEGKLDSMALAFAAHAQDDAANFKEFRIRQDIIEKKVIVFSAVAGALWASVILAVSNLDKIKHLFA